jgi:hypothetical protein
MLAHINKKSPKIFEDVLKYEESQFCQSRHPGSYLAAMGCMSVCYVEILFCLSYPFIRYGSKVNALMAYEHAIPGNHLVLCTRSNNEQGKKPKWQYFFHDRDDLHCLTRTIDPG